jgi:hypothetical protein
MPLSISTGVSKALGFTGSTAVLPSGAVYSFVVSPFGSSIVYNPMVPVPPVLLETSNNMNAQSFVFYVHGAGANAGYVDGRPLFWRIKHITTTAADFSETSGTFTSNNWGLSKYNPGYSWYNNPYGEELARFGISAIPENVTEGTETFQVEIREASLSGPVVLTSPVISLADTSAPATFTFDTDWNDAISQGGLTEGTTYEFRVNGINLSTEDDNFTYYTIDNKPINYNYPDAQYYTNAINKYGSAALPAMHIYVKNAEYLDNVPRPGYGSPTNTTRKETFGSGKFYILPRNDGITEGPTTHTIQLRTSPMNADYTGGATIATYTFTINDVLPILTNFEFQAIGGGAAGPISQAGGGGGAGQFYQARIYTSSSETFKVFIGATGIGRDTTMANSTILEGGELQNGSFYQQWIAYYGGWGATYGSNGLPSTTFGSTGGGCYTIPDQFKPDGRWPPGTLGNSASQASNAWDGVIYANRGGAAWSNSYITSAGGGGGAGGPGSDGVNNNLAGTGGPGILDWTGAYVCYGGGGVAYAGGFPIEPTNTAYAPRTASTYAGGSVPSAVLETPHGLANTGGGGSWGGRGGSGKFILRYPSTNRALALATGTYTTYISSGYRYYVWTGNGTFKVQ